MLLTAFLTLSDGQNRAVPTVPTFLSAAQAAGTHAGLPGLQVGAEPLARFLADKPNRLAIVLVATPGCPFCELVRQRELGPLLRQSPALANRVGTFEIMMRDPAQFNPAIDRLQTRDHGVLSNVKSPAALSAAMNLSFAPVVLFIGDQRELGEPLIGYSPDFYSAYLEQRIADSLASLAGPQQRPETETSE